MLINKKKPAAATSDKIYIRINEMTVILNCYVKIKTLFISSRNLKKKPLRQFHCNMDEKSVSWKRKMYD
jgi:hypothetical protein